MKQIVTRHRAGRGFTYRDEDGKTIKDAELRKWIQSLAIPPAWSEVHIDTDKSAKVHAWGRDDKGRKQYVYNQSWRAKKEQRKFDRIIAFAEKLPHMRRVTAQHLLRKDLDREKVLACMTRLLDEAYFRPGNRYYTKKNDSYGLTTLRSKHVTVKGSKVQFSYTGKSNQEQEKTVQDKRLAEIIRELDELPGYEIFQYLRNGQRIAVTNEDLNEYIKEVMGGEFSAKDFRTWAGTCLAAVALDELGVCTDRKQLPKNLKQAVERVASQLGNTPDIAKASYIDPRIIAHYEKGTTLKNVLENITDSMSDNLSKPEERAVLHLLQQAT